MSDETNETNETTESDTGFTEEFANRLVDAIETIAKDLGMTVEFGGFDFTCTFCGYPIMNYVNLVKLNDNPVPLAVGLPLDYITAQASQYAAHIVTAHSKGFDDQANSYLLRRMGELLRSKFGIGLNPN